jgi:branched-chain amino acid transport system substrate-binding protein
VPLAAGLACAKENMRHVLSVAALALALPFAGGGCALIRHLDDYTTADPQPTGAGGASPFTSDGISAAGATPPGGAACHANAECSADASKVCVRASGACVAVTSAECPRVYGDVANDDAVVVGALLGGQDDGALEGAARLAAEELDAAAAGGGLPPADPGGPARPLVLVACEASGDVLAAARHLAVDLRVPAIVGPTAAEDVIDATQQITAKAGAVLMTPTSLASQITSLADGDLTWRVRASDEQRAKLVIEQVDELEDVLKTTRSLTTVKLAMVHRTDAAGTSARDAVAGTLILNGRFISDPANAANVSVDAYAPGDEPAGQEAIVAKYASRFAPDVVLLTAPEQIAGVLVPLEQALTTARAVYRPYWVVAEAAKTAELLDALGAPGMPADLRRRIRGVGTKADASSQPVLDAFRAAYEARFGAAPATPDAFAAAAATYDATYALAFAVAVGATDGAPLSGASVAHGLRSLGVGAPAPVGASALGFAMQTVASGKSVSLRGTSGPLRWNASGDVAAGTIEVWCIGAGGGAPAFGSSGLTMDVETQVVGGAFVQCQ